MDPFFMEEELGKKWRLKRRWGGWVHKRMVRDSAVLKFRSQEEPSKSVKKLCPPHKLAGKVSHCKQKLIVFGSSTCLMRC